MVDAVKTDPFGKVNAIDVLDFTAANRSHCRQHFSPPKR